MERHYQGRRLAAPQMHFVRSRQSSGDHHSITEAPTRPELWCRSLQIAAFHAWAMSSPAHTGDSEKPSGHRSRIRYSQQRCPSKSGLELREIWWIILHGEKSMSWGHPESQVDTDYLFLLW
jgi:hypothetical protein